MNIGFIIEGWEEINVQLSSTLRIIRECVARGHKVSVFGPNNMTVRNNVVHGFVRRIDEMEKVPDTCSAFYKRVKLSDKLVPLHGFDCIMIRHDPPISPITYNFLDSVKSQTVVINDVDGLRKANNKLYTTTFNDPNNEFLPITHVSKNKDYLMRMIEESPHDKMILKPLDGSGGHGVIVLEKGAMSSVKSLLDFYIHRDSGSYVILQEYIEGAEEGDIRVLMLGGKFLGAYQRKPAEGDIRANIQAGGSAHKVTLSESQMHVCKKVGPKLSGDGLNFVGLDLIGDKILEVNVLNPGGITNINRLNKLRLEKQVVDFLEEKVHEREDQRAELEFLIRRLSEFRNSDSI